MTQFLSGQSGAFVIEPGHSIGMHSTLRFKIMPGGQPSLFPFSCSLNDFADSVSSDEFTAVGLSNVR